MTAAIPRHPAILLALAALLAGGCASPPKELDALRSKESKDRVEAAVTLSTKIVEGDEEYLPHRQEIAAGLRGLLDDKSALHEGGGALVRQVAIDALAKVEGKTAAPAIAD